jgi:hypothetical protein
MGQLLGGCHYCAAQAGNGEIKFEATNQHQEEWTCYWDKGTLTYRLSNFSEDFNMKWQKRVVTDAFMFWQLRIKDLKFKQIRDPDEQVDINIVFKPQNHFAQPEIYAQAYYPCQGLASGDIEINDGWDWRASVRRADKEHPPLLPIMIHELGHSLGLSHDRQSNWSIMWPYFQLGDSKTTLGPRDIERIQKIYGKRTGLQRLIDIIRKRAISGSTYE